MLFLKILFTFVMALAHDSIKSKIKSFRDTLTLAILKVSLVNQKFQMKSFTIQFVLVLKDQLNIMNFLKLNLYFK